MASEKQNNKIYHYLFNHTCDSLPIKSEFEENKKMIDK